MKRIDQFQTLKQLAQSVSQRERLREIVQSALPVSLHESIADVTLTPRGTLIATWDGAWATRLRFQAETIREALAAHFPHQTIGSVRIRVIPPPPRPRAAFQPPPTLSSETRARTMALAQSLEDESLRRKLAALLERLSETPR